MRSLLSRTCLKKAPAWSSLRMTSWLFWLQVLSIVQTNLRSKSWLGSPSMFRAKERTTLLCLRCRQSQLCWPLSKADWASSRPSTSSAGCNLLSCLLPRLKTVQQLLPYWLTTYTKPSRNGALKKMAWAFSSVNPAKKVLAMHEFKEWNWSQTTTSSTYLFESVYVYFTHALLFLKMFQILITLFLHL